MGLKFKVTENIVIPVTLTGGESNRHIQVKVYDRNGANMVGGDGFLSMVHIDNGYYLTNEPLTLPIGFYTIVSQPFLDAGYSSPDNKYGRASDDLEVEGTDTFSDVTEIIEDAVAKFQQADFEIEIDDVTEEIEIELLN